MLLIISSDTRKIRGLYFILCVLNDVLPRIPKLLGLALHLSFSLLIHLPSACRGRTAVQFPATSSHMCCLGLALKGVLCTSVKGHIGLLVLLLPKGYAMLTRPNKAETAVRGCHCLGDMAMCMHMALARPWVGVRVCHLLLLCLFAFVDK